jgi:hemolysin III
MFGWINNLREPINGFTHIIGAVLSIAGMCLKLTLRHPPQSVIGTLFSFFIIMGWLIVIAWRPLVKTLPKPAIRGLVAGGLFYTFGAIDFVFQKQYNKSLIKGNTSQSL